MTGSKVPKGAPGMVGKEARQSPLAAALLAGIYPAIKMATSTPAEALREE